MLYLPLTDGNFAIIDDEDYQRLSQWTWKPHKGRSDNIYAIRSTTYRGKSIKRALHHDVLNLPLPNPVTRGQVVDHINRHPLDCRKENLRLCSVSQNLHNAPPLRRKNKTSAYRGVSFYRDIKRWIPKLQFRGRTYNLGVYKREYDAVIAYNRAAVKIVGPYAYVNRWLGPTLPPPPGAEEVLKEKPDYANPHLPKKPPLDPKKLPPGIQLYFDFYYETKDDTNNSKRRRK